jgi:hypothetical protein
VAVVVGSGFVCQDESGTKKSRRDCAFVSINALQSEQSDAAATAEDAAATAEDAEATAEDSSPVFVEKDEENGIGGLTSGASHSPLLC